MPSAVCLPPPKVIRLRVTFNLPSGPLLRAGSGAPCLPEEREFRTWVCPRDGTRVQRPVRCKEARLCPTCSKQWSWDEGHAASRRLTRTAIAWDLMYEPRHVVVAFGDRQGAALPWDGPELTAEFARAWRLLKYVGVKGGLLIFHPWRHGPGDRGCQEWREGPHFHGMLYGRVDEWRRPPGTFVRVMRKRQKTVAGTVAYLLDHAGFFRRSHAVRWFGIASYRMLGPSGPQEHGPMLCPLCGSEMELEGRAEVVDWTGPPRWVNK